MSRVRIAKLPAAPETPRTGEMSDGDMSEVVRMVLERVPTLKKKGKK